MSIHKIGPQVIDARRLSGQKNETVEEVQATLNHLGRHLATDGHFDAATVRAVSRFQQAHHLEGRGRINQATVDAMNLAEARLHDGFERSGPSRGGPAAQPRTDGSAPAAAPGAQRPSESLAPRPAAPPQTSPAAAALVEQHTAARIPAGQRAQFDQIERANLMTESHGTFQASHTPTSAGAPASYGAGQLTTDRQLGALLSYDDASLGALGMNRAALQSLDAHGRATRSWYDATMGVRPARGDPGPQGLSPAERSQLHALAGQGNTREIVRQFGDRFASQTGLPPAELGQLAQTALLRNHAYRAEYAGIADGLQHGLPRDRRAAAGREMIQRHPELAPLGERLSPGGLGFYLESGRLNENRNGWYTRGAQTQPQFDGFVGQLAAGGDAVTTRDRSIANFVRAQDALRNVSDLGSLNAHDQAGLVGAVARLNHFRPAAVVSLGHPTSVADLRARLAALPAQDQVAMANFSRNFEHSAD